MSQNVIVRYYIPCLGFEVVYVLVRWPFTAESVKGRCLEFGRVGPHPILLSRVGLSPIPTSWSPSWLARASRRCSNLLILLEWVLPFSELPSSSDEDLDSSEFECSSFSVFTEDDLSLSFCLSLDFLEGVLAFGFFLFYTAVIASA